MINLPLTGELNAKLKAVLAEPMNLRNICFEKDITIDMYFFALGKRRTIELGWSLSENFFHMLVPSFIISTNPVKEATMCG